MVRTNVISLTARCAAALLLLAIGAPAGAAPAATSRPAGSEASARTLKAECDRAVQDAERTPFGWGWASERPDLGALAAPQPAPAPPRREAAVEIDTMTTAAVGAQLLWAGRKFSNDSYLTAAREAGRGLATLQLPTGQVRRGGVIGRPGPREQHADIVERRLTRAALGLWLALLEDERQQQKAANDPARPDGADEAKRDERMARAAAAAANWLARQQIGGGAWPVLHPLGSPPGKGDRIIRLDLPDYRDNTIALLLAADVLNDKHLAAAAQRATQTLLNLRVQIGGRGTTRALWEGVYTMAGEPNRKIAEFPQGIDLVASRHAAEALLASYLLTMDADHDTAANVAATAVTTLPKHVSGQWHRRYDREGAPLSRVPPTNETGSPLSFPPPVPPDAFADPSLTPLTETIAYIQKVGGRKYADELAARLPLRSRLVELLCGLTDAALCPTTDPAPPTDPSPGPRAIALHDAIRSHLGVGTKP